MLTGALIGLGRMGLAHFSILNSHPGVQILAVCDSTPLVLRFLQKHCPIQTFSNYGEMLGALKLDFAVISTPPASHASIVEECLKRRICVFVEKPLCGDWSKSKSVTQLALNARVVNQVGYVNRFNRVFLAVQELLQNDVLGKLAHFTCQMHASTVTGPVRSGWRSIRDEGGCLREFGAHGIDLLHFLFGKPTTVCGIVLKSIFSREVDDFVSCTFLYQDNLSGHLHVDWTDTAYRKPAYNLEIVGERGKIWADQHSYKLYLKSNSLLAGLRQGWTSKHITDLAGPVRFYVRGNEFTEQLDYFVDNVARNCLVNVNSFLSAAETDRLISDLLSCRNTRPAERCAMTSIISA